MSVPPDSPPSSDRRPLQILDLPRECLLHVFKWTNSSFQELQTLRKTCSTFRDAIDTDPLTIYQTATHLKFTRDSIIIGMDVNDRTTDVEYQQTEDGCLIDRYWRDEHKSKYLSNQEMLHQWEECATQGKRRYYEAEQGKMIDWYGKRRRFLIDENILGVAYEDFESMLKHQNLATFDSLRFHFGSKEVEEQERQTFYFRKKLNNYLKSRKKPLKVKKLLFTVTLQEEIMSILPFVDPMVIEEVWIFDYRDEEEKDRELFPIDEIVETRQWKKAKVVRRDGSDIAPEWIDHFMGRTMAVVHLKTVPLAMMLKIREAFLNPASTNTEFVINFSDPAFRIDQFIAFGEFKEYRNHHVYEWFFRTLPNTGQLLKVHLSYLYMDGRIHFSHVAESEIDRDAVVNFIDRNRQ